MDFFQPFALRRGKQQVEQDTGSDKDGGILAQQANQRPEKQQRYIRRHKYSTDGKQHSRIDHDDEYKCPFGIIE